MTVRYYNRYRSSSILSSNDGQVMEAVSGQLDLRPTLLHLLGIDTSKDMQLGADLFSEEHEDFVIFRDGRFITDKVVYAGEVCYDRETGVEVDIAGCQPYIERATKELGYSDQLLTAIYYASMMLKRGI